MTREVNDRAFAATPHHRHEVVLLSEPRGIGIELGVAEGMFAERALALNFLGFLYGVDAYAGDRQHDTAQYLRALARLRKFRSSHGLLRMRFDEALPLFDDQTFDFIYVDGYAHTGEEGGRTMELWLPKLRLGGIMAGDDFSEKYPLVVKAVQKFAANHALEVHIMNTIKGTDVWSKQPSWFIRK